MIFVDTSFLVALRNRRDGQHDQATRLWRCYDLMRVRRIREALAFDGDFAAAGFTELRVQARNP
jgi:predicted nucleic acid-binding protein